MGDTPDVSVVIPVYNGEAFVADAVTSALDQTLGPREVIVVDDGSTDNTHDVLARFGDHIRVIRQANGGPAAARNSGIRLARGEWVGFLDADDTWRPEKLERIAAHLSEKPSAQMVFSAVHHWWEDDGRAKDRRRDHDLDCREIFAELAFGNVILGGGSGPVVRTACLKGLGLFDEALIGAEDWDMWIRIAESCDVLYVDEVLVNYRGRAGSVSRAVDRMLDAQLRTLQKHRKRFLAAGVSAFHLRRAKARFYLGAGNEHLLQNNRKAARRAILKAVLCNPFETGAILPMANLLLGIRHSIREALHPAHR